MFRPIAFFCFLSLVTPMAAQPGWALERSQPVDPNRYSGIRGTPYLWEEFQPAGITLTDGSQIFGILVNLNGYTGLLEARHNGQYIELDDPQFVSVRIRPEDSTCASPVISRYRHSKILSSYPIHYFAGDRYQLIRDFRAGLTENKVNTPGKTEVLKSFSDESAYYLGEDGSLALVRLNRKSAEKLFPQSETFIRASKPDLSRPEGWCQLLLWVEANVPR